VRLKCDDDFFFVKKNTRSTPPRGEAVKEKIVEQRVDARYGKEKEKTVEEEKVRMGWYS